jgi:hypothetical protein
VLVKQEISRLKRGALGKERSGGECDARTTGEQRDN